MVFMKACRSSMYPDYKAEGAYMEYKNVKSIMNQIKEGNNPTTPDHVYDALLAEVQKVYKWGTVKAEELIRVALQLAKTSGSMGESNWFGAAQKKDGDDDGVDELTKLLATIDSSFVPVTAARGTPVPENAAASPSADPLLVQQEDEMLAQMEDPENIRFNPVTLRKAADAVVFETLRFQEALNLNDDCIIRLLIRYERFSVLSPTKRWLTVKEGCDFMKISIDEPMYVMSLCYMKARRLEEGYVRLKQRQKRRRIDATRRRRGGGSSSPVFDSQQIISSIDDGHLASGSKGQFTAVLLAAAAERAGKKKADAGAAASQTFDRRSVKYWVHYQDLPFVIARIIQHLPLSTIKDFYTDSKEKGYKYSLASKITSIYFDNKDFLFYHRRLERLEESSLLRVRWYTDNEQADANYVDPESNVFVEIKVHHEAWSGERSTKRRFVIKDKNLDSFLRGDYPLDGNIAALKKKGAGAKDIQEFTQLANEVIHVVQNYKLLPALKTQYARMAFQNGLDQSVRISIDCELVMAAEDFGLSKHWRYTGPPGDIPHTLFPYAVVEVKLQCAENERIAPWIEELLQCRFMESIPKFSKYGHGIAQVFGNKPGIQMVPYWLSQMGTEIRAATKPDEGDWDPVKGLAMGMMARLTDYLIFGKSGEHAQTQTVGASQVHFLQDQRELMLTYLKLAGKEAQIPTAPLDMSLNTRQENYLELGIFSKEARTAEANCTELILHEMVARNNEDVLESEGHVRIPVQLLKRIRTPQKTDPKTFFAAERYFMKWLVRSLHLGLVGLALIHFGGSNYFPIRVDSLAGQHEQQEEYNKMGFFQRALYTWRMHGHVVIGVMLVVICVLTSWFSLLMYHARTKRLYARARKVRYDSVNGPTYLTFVLLFMISLIGVDRLWLRFGPMLTRDPSF